MFDFQKELYDETIKAYHIDLVSTTEFPFEPVEVWHFGENYRIGNIIKVLNRVTDAILIDKHFSLRIELELRDYLRNANTLKELNSRIKEVSGRQEWFECAKDRIKVEEATTPEDIAIEYSFEVSNKYCKKIRKLPEKEAIANFNNRIIEVQKRINDNVNAYILEIIDKLLTRELLEQIEQSIVNNTKIGREIGVEKSNELLPLSLNKINPINQVDFENDLWDMLRSKNFISPTSTKVEFKRLFSKGVAIDQKLDWVDTISTLALFLKNLPVENDNVPQIGAASFTCKGKSITNMQLINNGRIPKSKKEIDLVAFLKDLVATH